MRELLRKLSPMGVFVLVRHGQSLLNVDGVVNGDPRRDFGLSPLGIEQARRLGGQLAPLALDLAVVSPFPRAIETLDLALAGRAIPRVVDDDLGDIRLGELEGGTVAEYRAATAHGDRNQRFPGGESLNEAAHRYARAFKRLLARSERGTLVVCHEMVVRYSVNAAGGSDDLDRPLHDVVNAAPYLFDEAGLEAAVTRMLVLAR